MCPGILFHIMRGPPHRGGQITYLKYIIRNIIDRDYCNPCIIFSHRMREKYLDLNTPISLFNGKIIIMKKGMPYSPYSLDSILLKPMQILYDSHIIRKIITKYNINLLHVVGPGPEITYAFPPPSHIEFLVRTKTSTPKVTFTISPWNFLHNSRIGKIYTLLDSPLITPSKVFISKVMKILEIFDIIIVHLKESFIYVKKIARDLGQGTNKVKFIPFGINLTLFDPKRFPLNRIFSESISRRELYILCPARIAPEKNQLTVLKAIYLLSKLLKNFKIKCDFVGEIQDEKYYNMLSNLVRRLGLEKYVRFMGGVPYSNMPYVYAMHDLVILSSKRELLSSAILEAMAMRKPTICPRLPSILLAFEENKHCLMINPHDAKELVNKVLFLTQNPSIADKLGVNGRSLIKQEFNLEKTLSDTIKIYERYF